jgi:hypothetical protein
LAAISCPDDRRWPPIGLLATAGPPAAILSPPQAVDEDCPGFTDFGQDIGLPPGGAPSFVCAGDMVQGEPLQYDQSMRAGALQCDSPESGVTCHDVNTGRGFSLSCEEYVLF